jgi:hypothetical protein
MPGGYIIDEECGIVLSRGWCEVTGEQMHMHARALASDRRFAPQYRQLVDLRAVTRADLPATAVWSLADDSPFGPGSRRAIVVGSNMMFGMARMFEMLRDGHKEAFLVSRDIDDAIDWLDIGRDRGAVLAALARVPDMVGEWMSARRPTASPG